MQYKESGKAKGMNMTPNGHQISARQTAITGPYELSSGLHLFTDWRFIIPSFKLRSAKLYAFEIT